MWQDSVLLVYALCLIFAWEVYMDMVNTVCRYFKIYICSEPIFFYIAFLSNPTVMMWVMQCFSMLIWLLLSLCVATWKNSKEIWQRLLEFLVPRKGSCNVQGCYCANVVWLHCNFRALNRGTNAKGIQKQCVLWLIQLMFLFHAQNCTMTDPEFNLKLRVSKSLTPMPSTFHTIVLCPLGRTKQKQWTFQIYIYNQCGHMNSSVRLHSYLQKANYFYFCPEY